MSDAQRRKHLFNGQLFVFSPCPSALTFCQFARQMIEEAFAPLEPTEAQHSLPVEEYVAILAKLKPTFIAHPQSKHFIQSILKELRCDLSKTYFNIPHLRTVTSGEYLTSDNTYVPPHRDTGYSAFCPVNWWLPIYDIEPENALAFHPRYWSQPVNSAVKPSRAEDPPESTQVRLICNVGGIVLFSGAQMHSTVPNRSGRTRFSIDFRTVHINHINDVAAQAGALNVEHRSQQERHSSADLRFPPLEEARTRNSACPSPHLELSPDERRVPNSERHQLTNPKGRVICDSASTGTTLRDFICATNFSPMPENFYEDKSSEPVFKPTASA